jgi:hypothetical protein
MAQKWPKMGRDAVKNCRKLTRPQMRDLVDRIHGSDGEGGDGSQAMGTLPVRDMATSGGRRTPDGDYKVAQQVVSLTRLREIKGAVAINGLREPEALALAEWFDKCGCNVSKGLVACCLGFGTRQALDRAMMDIGHSLMHRGRGRISG